MAGLFNRTHRVSALTLPLMVATSLLLWLSHLPVHALDPSRELTQFVIDVWNSEDGLPQNGVEAIAQTVDGYLWVGTQGGLARFDGLTFTVFDSSNTGVLQSDDIVTLLGDSRGDLWIGTESGLYRYDGIVFTACRGKDYPVDRVESLFEDSRGRVWVGSLKEALRVVEDGRIRIFRDDTGKTLHRVNDIMERADGELCFASLGIDCLLDDKFHAVGTGPDGITDINCEAVATHDGKMVAGTTGRGLLMETSAGSDVFMPVGDLPHELISSIMVDRQDELWVSTYGGLARVRQGGAEALTIEDGIPHSRITALMEDHEGSLWLGTNGGGLVRLRDKRLGTLSVGEGLAALSAQAVLEDRDGYLWLATGGGNLQRYRDGAWKRFGPTDGLPECDINALWEGEPGTLWVGTGTGGIFRFRNNRFEAVPATFKIFLAGLTEVDGAVWAGGTNGLQQLHDGRFITPAWSRDLRRISTLYRDRNGTLWIGTFGLGLTSYRDGVVTTFTTLDGLSSDNILALYEDEDGALWIATYGGGLVRLKEGTFTAITTAEGLPQDEIYAVLEDDHGRLWISTPVGIAAVDRGELNALADGTIEAVNPVIFGTADGMRNAECNGGFQPAGWKTRDGKLWFPTVDGFVTIDPTRMAANRPPPPVRVERVLADGTELDAAAGGSVMSVRPGRGNLEFHYTALSFLDAGSIRFRYFLDGFDDAWTDADTRRTAYYTNVPPGRYTFRVNACNNAGSWNAADTVISLRLASHYYQSYWFYGVWVLALGLGAYGLHHYRVNRILELERVRTRIATDLHDDIGSSLSQISILSEVLRYRIPDGDETIDGPLARIAESSRELIDSMSDIVWAVNPKRDSLDNLVFRMRRFASDALTAREIEFSFRAPSRVSDLPLGADFRRELYLVFKESLNNAIRHSGCDRVEITLDTEGGHLVLTVHDNGRGFDTALETDGHGLASMARRAEWLGGSFRVESEPGRGTMLRLDAPLSSRRGRR